MSRPVSEANSLDIGAAAQLGLAAALGAIGKAAVTRLLRVARPPRQPLGLSEQIEQLRHEMQHGFRDVRDRLDSSDGDVSELKGQLLHVKRRLSAEFGD